MIDKLRLYTYAILNVTVGECCYHLKQTTICYCNSKFQLILQQASDPQNGFPDIY
jgi:hypothetical protein